MRKIFKLNVPSLFNYSFSGDEFLTQETFNGQMNCASD